MSLSGLKSRLSGLSAFRGGGGSTPQPALTGSTPTLIATSRPGSWYSPLTDQSVPATAVGGVNVASGSTTTARSGVSPLGVWCVADVAVTAFSGSDTEDSVYTGLIATTAKVVGGLDKAVGKAFIEVTTAGGVTTRVNATPTITVANGDVIRVAIIGGVGTGASPADGCWVQVYRSQDGGTTWAYLTDRLCTELDLRVTATLATLEYGYAVRATDTGGGTRSFTLGDFRAGYYGGSGVQNPSFVLDDSGGYVRHADGRYYVAHTVGGRNGADPGSGTTNIDRVSFICQGVGLYEPVTNTLTQAALLFFADGTRTVGHSPASVTKHRTGCGTPYDGKWVVMVSGWGRANGSTNVPSLLATPTLSTDVLSGVNVLATTSVTPPINSPNCYDWSSVAWEDGALWASWATAAYGTPSDWVYYPAFGTGLDLTALTFVGVDYGYAARCEGATAYRAGGELRYVAAGIDKLWREYTRAGTPVGRVDGAGLFTSALAPHLTLYRSGTTLRGLSFDTDVSTTLAGDMPWAHGNLRQLNFAGGDTAPFVPPTQAVDEAGLTPLAWVRADAEYLCSDEFGTTPCAAGQAIWSWNDRTGRPGPWRGLVQPSAGNRLTAQSGYAASAANDFAIGNAAVTGDVWCIAVAKWAGTGTYSRLCTLKAISEANDYSGPLGCVMIAADSGNWLGYYNGALRATSPASIGNYQIIDSRWEGTTHTLRVAAGAAATAAVPTMALASNLWAVGWDGVNGASAFEGEIKEIRVYSPVPSAADRNIIRAALGATYGLPV